MSSVNSFKLVGFGSAVVVAGFAFTFGCGSSNDNSARTGTGGTGATTGGATGTTGGNTATTGGNTATTGGTGTGTGGSTPTAGTGGGGTDVCGLPATAPADALIFVGNMNSCGSSIAMPHKGFWFSYGDTTVTSADAGYISALGAVGGCGGPTDCAYHAKGAGYADYGAGIGFDLNDDSSSPAVAQNFDARPYAGLQFYAKGTITGTRGPKYAATDQEIHVKIVTATDRHGDDYGGYCIIGADWTKCSVTFSSAARDGFSAMPDPATDMLDLMAVQKIQLEFSRYSPPADSGTSPPVAFDVFVDDVSFF